MGSPRNAACLACLSSQLNEKKWLRQLLPACFVVSCLVKKEKMRRQLMNRPILCVTAPRT